MSSINVPIHRLSSIVFYLLNENNYLQGQSQKWHICQRSLMSLYLQLLSFLPSHVLPACKPILLSSFFSPPPPTKDLWTFWLSSYLQFLTLDAKILKGAVYMHSLPTSHSHFSSPHVTSAYADPLKLLQPPTKVHSYICFFFFCQFSRMLVNIPITKTFIHSSWNMLGALPFPRQYMNSLQGSSALM